MRTIRPTLVAALAAVLLAPAAAAAHVTVAPDTAEAGETADLTVRVPNESPTENVIELSVQFSPAVDGVRPGDVPGWEVELEESGGKVRTITWSGNGNSGKIVPNAAGEFPIAVDVPDDADRVTIKAVERYDGGKVSRWIGAPDAENPAPVVRVSGAVAEVGDEPEPAPVEEPTATTGVPGPDATDGAEAPEPSPSTDEAPASSDDDEDEDGSGTVVIAVVIALLVGAAAGVVILRRRRTP